MGDSITKLGTGSRGWVKYFNEVIQPEKTVIVAENSATLTDRSATVYDGNPVFNGADNNINNVLGNQVEKILRGKDTTNPNYSTVADYTDFDMIFIAIGTNDGNPYGDIEASFFADGVVVPVASVDRKTWHGAFRYCIENLQRVYPNATIFVCTPIQAVEATRSYSSIKTKGEYLKQLCARMSVNCIDTFMCGICGMYEVKNAEGRDLIDGLHPNVSGAKKIGKYNAAEVIKHYLSAAEFVADAGGSGSGGNTGGDTGGSGDNTSGGTTTPDEDYTDVNLLPTAIDASGAVFNGVGYINNTVLNGNNPAETTTRFNYVTTGYIPVSMDDLIYTAGTGIFAKGDNYARIYVFDSNKACLGYVAPEGFYTDEVDATGNLIGYRVNHKYFALGTSANSFNVDNIAYIRMALKGKGDDLMVTTRPIKVPPDNGYTEEEEETSVNLLTLAEAEDGTIFNEVGYMNGYRLSSSNPKNHSAKAGYVATGYIPILNGQVLYTSGSAVFKSGDTECKVAVFDSEKTCLGYASILGSAFSGHTDDAGNLVGFPITNGYYAPGSSSNPYGVNTGVAYIRFSMYGTGDTLVVSTSPIT
jgi:lysophospholipase L1-like esterase